jgi:hypothetical protein
LLWYRISHTAVLATDRALFGITCAGWPQSDGKWVNKAEHPEITEGPKELLTFLHRLDDWVDLTPHEPEPDSMPTPTSVRSSSDSLIARAHS